MLRTTLTLSLTLVLATACMEGRDTFTLKADGSGTISGKYVIDVPKAKELLAAAGPLLGATVEMDGEEALSRNPFAAAWFRSFAKSSDGYDITEASEKTEDGKRTNLVTATFTSLQAAAKGGAFFASTVSLSKVDKSEKVPGGAWKLVLAEDLLSNPEATGGMDIKSALPMFEMYIKKLSLGRTITFPSKVLETNGEKSEDGMTVAWTVTYDKILEGKGLKAIVVFEATESLELKPFTYSPDLMQLAKRFVEKPPEEAPSPADGGKESGSGGQKPAEEDAAKSAAAKVHLSSFGQAIDNYRLTNKKLPASLETLTKASEPNAEPFLERVPQDPWGNAYEYRVLDAKSYRIRSFGPDGEPDSADDIVYPAP